MRFSHPLVRGLVERLALRDAERCAFVAVRLE
jgi:hypothetical protein